VLPAWLRFTGASLVAGPVLTVATTASPAKCATEVSGDFHVERDPIDSDEPDGLCRPGRVRVAPAVAARRIRPELDEALDDRRHDHFADGAWQHAYFAERAQQYATVHRTIDMTTATSGR
jgi:hypothetical protein